MSHDIHDTAGPDHDRLQIPVGKLGTLTSITLESGETEDTSGDYV